MASSSKPAIVIAHGVWHSPLTYARFTDALRHAEYDVHIPYLPSCTGTRPPTAGLLDDIQLIRRLVEMLADQGRSVIMLLHSYGGVVGSGALEGLDLASRADAGKRGGVVHLVGLAAHFHPLGFSVLDLIREMGNEDVIPLAFDIAEDRSCMSADARALLFAGLSVAEADELLLTLSRANIDCMEGKVRFEAWKHIPITYVHTTHDATLPSHYQQRIVEKMQEAGAHVNAVSLETGHSLHATKTKEVVEIIQDVTNNFVESLASAEAG